MSRRVSLRLLGQGPFDSGACSDCRRGGMIVISSTKRGCVKPALRPKKGSLPV